MKAQFIEFLFKRISTKINDIADPDVVENYTNIEDLEVYINTLKEIVMEVIKP